MFVLKNSQSFLLYLFLITFLLISSNKQNQNILCIFNSFTFDSKTNKPIELLQLLSLYPSLTINNIYNNLYYYNFYIVSLSFPIYIQNDDNNTQNESQNNTQNDINNYYQKLLIDKISDEIICEPVYNMKISTNEYFKLIQNRYHSSRQRVEKSIQCTITYDVFNNLKNYNTTQSPSEIVSI